MKKQLSPYLRLMRIEKPVGFFLLLWPTLWALWVASNGVVSIRLFFIFVTGVFVMRSAGCVINDIADRNFDPHVARTATRPLAAGEITLKKAIILLVFLLFLALGLVFCLNLLCFKLACIGVGITIIYPFMKRWISAPQCVLGIAFSIGIPMAFAAVSGDNAKLVELPHLPHFSWILWGMGILWPIIYDTLYAMTDREDDQKIGINSTAILFGKNDRRIVFVLELMWFICWIILAQKLELGNTFYLCLLIAIILCTYEHILIRHRKPIDCFRAFLNHAWIGSILFLGLAFSL